MRARPSECAAASSRPGAPSVRAAGRGEDGLQLSPQASLGPGLEAQAPGGYF